jgi:sulfur carrier protein
MSPLRGCQTSDPPMNTTQKIPITVNGQPREITAGSSVISMLQQLNIDPARVAVELNRSIVRKPDWPSTPVEPNAQIEIVEFVGGG